LKTLKDKVGPVLFQLPPQFEADRERLLAASTSACQTAKPSSAVGNLNAPSRLGT